MLQIGPIRLPARLNGENYLQFLQEQLPNLIDQLNLPPAIVDRIHFMQDGAPPHYHREVRNYLNQAYPNRWISRAGPIAWPARSPDLNPCDYFLWGYVKNEVYQGDIVENEMVLWERIQHCFDSLRGNPEMLSRATQDISRRLQFCLANNGQHFEQFPHDRIFDGQNDQL